MTWNDNKNRLIPNNEWDNSRIKNISEYCELPTMHESDITQQNEQHLVSKVFDERLRPNIIIY